MIGNWKVTAWLSSPLAGEPPYLDAVLQWELACRIGIKQGRKLTRDTRLADVPPVPVPLCKRTLSGHDIFTCSDPIIPLPKAEWVDRVAKRFDGHAVALLLDPDERKAIGVTSGPYKMRYAPVRVRLVDRVSWFFRGDKYEIRRILKSVFAIGSNRKIGYGIVSKWDFEECPEENSIFAEADDGRILMKTVPTGPHLDNITGFKKSFGGGLPPYWHPENYMEIAVPC